MPLLALIGDYDPLKTAHRAIPRALELAGQRFTGFDGAGKIPAFELPARRFFIGTLFQPERSALQEQTHPLIEAFVHAIAGR